MPANKGSRHHAAKMTEVTVRAARRAAHRGGEIMVDGKRRTVTTSSLARKYGVTHQTMRSILMGETWRHVS